jgi:hypothetical protein
VRSGVFASGAGASSISFLVSGGRAGTVGSSTIAAAFAVSSAEGGSSTFFFLIAGFLTWPNLSASANCAFLTLIFKFLAKD